MDTVTKPSFSACYYLRTILAQHTDQIQGILTQKTGFCFSSESDLRELLDSVYLEDVLEQLLKRLYVDEAEIARRVRQLETLAARYRKLATQDLLYSQDCAEIKQQIFWILGFKRIVVNTADIVFVLNELNQFSNSYLGATLSHNAWQSSRPHVEWLSQFQLNRSTGFKFAEGNRDLTHATELQAIQEWISAFVKRSSQVIRDFKSTLAERGIGELSQGISLTHTASYAACLTDLPDGGGAPVSPDLLAK
jgi:hypothetical protein